MKTKHKILIVFCLWGICSLLLVIFICRYSAKPKAADATASETIIIDIFAPVELYEQYKADTKRKDLAPKPSNIPINQNLYTKDDCLWVGDSLSYGLSLQFGVKSFAKTGITPQGLTNAVLNNSTLNMKILSSDPKFIFLTIGVNSLNSATWYEDWVECAEWVQENTFSGTTLVITTLTPWRGHDSQIAKCNALIKDYCDENDITLFDIHEIFSNRPEYYNEDGLHMNTTGKQVWLDSELDFINSLD